MTHPENNALIEQVHHVGISVQDMDRALAFWKGFLGIEPISRRVNDAPFLGELVGKPGAIMEVAWLDLPPGLALELVRFERPVGTPMPIGSEHPGAVHLCLGVADLTAALASAIRAGATQSSVAPVEIPSGPNQGARHVYIRDPDGVAIELRQAPPSPVSPS
jgi:catechol 2,3-dioxygenase-like lactoylglutathione lyase family enzyme